MAGLTALAVFTVVGTIGADRHQIADRPLDALALLLVLVAPVALAWVRAQPGVVIPILGARKLSQLEDNLAALDVRLAPEQLARLDAASAVPLGFPHDFVNSENLRPVVLGTHHARIDVHRPR